MRVLAAQMGVGLWYYFPQRYPQERLWARNQDFTGMYVFTCTSRKTLH